MDGWTDGWMDGRTDGRTDGRMDGCNVRNSFETHLSTIQSNWITSAISYPAILPPVHTQRPPVTCKADVFQGTFTTRNKFIAFYHLLVRHDGFVWSLTKNHWSIAVVSYPGCPIRSWRLRASARRADSKTFRNQ